jgi:hypothetical protein
MEFHVTEWYAGQKVRIKSLTDIDTGEPETDTIDGHKLIGRTATIIDPYLCDYYDCTIQLDEPLGELGDTFKGYGEPPVLAFQHKDLEKIDA